MENKITTDWLLQNNFVEDGEEQGLFIYIGDDEVDEDLCYESKNYPFVLTTSFGGFKFCVSSSRSTLSQEEWMDMDTPYKIKALYLALTGKEIIFNTETE